MSLLILAGPPLAGLLTLLIYVVVFLIIAGLLFWAINRLCAAFGIPEPIHTVLIVALVIIVIVALLYFLTGYMPR
jgi:energy-converting hydrogenase Eha subunit B